MRFEFIKGVKTNLHTPCQLPDLDLKEPNTSKIEFHEYGYTIFKPLPNIDDSSSKNSPLSSVTIANVEIKDHNNTAVVRDEGIEAHLSLNPDKLIHMQNDDTFCRTIIKLMNKKKLSSSKRYLVSDKKLLHKFVRNDDKSFHAL